MHISRFLSARFACLVMLVAVASCVTTGMKAGPLKNNLPVIAKENLEEVHSIAIPQFYNDRMNWKEITFEVLFASKRIVALPPDRVDAGVRSALPNFGSLSPEDRAAALAKTSKAVHADAVINGMIIPRADADELVIQLLSLKDGRVLFLQTVDLSPRDGQMEHAARKAILADMLAPVIENAGKRKKPAPAPVVIYPREEPKPIIIEPQTTTPSKPEPLPKPEKRQKKPKSAPAPDKISPM